MERVSTHHKEMVLVIYKDCSNEGEIAQKAREVVEDKRYDRDEMGRLAYPGLGEETLHEKVLKAEILQARAVLTGNFEEIGDFTESGRVNFDNYCLACPNVRLKKRICILRERLLSWVYNG